MTQKSQEPNVVETLDAKIKELSEALQQYAKVSKKRIEQEKEQHRDSVLKSEKFKALKSQFAEAVTQIKSFAKGKRQLNLTIPITFTSQIEFDTLHHLDWSELEISDFLQKGAVTAKIGNVEDITKKQKSTLQIGINEVLNNACSEVFDLFPKLEEELEEVIENYNKVIAEITELLPNVSLDDLGYKP